MLGSYRSIAKLGQGGMAEVRLALAQRAGGFNKLLVLKLLREDLAADREFMAMFLAEARVAALLNHRNIVQTNEVGADEGRHFMAMEYLEGQSFSALLLRVGRETLPVDLQVYVLAETLHGLHYAHQLTDLDGTALSVIHRDVSPQNVFVTYSGQVKLLDFGIAKISSASEMTRSGTIKGKAGYMAPEQARMQGNIDRRADIFAVGVMLWEALAGRRFVPAGEAEIAILHRRVADEDLKLADIAPNADPVLAAICNKAIAFDRDERWPDAQAFAEALEGWLSKSRDVLEKQLGRIITEQFNDERSQIRRVIEEESAKAIRTDESTPLNLRELAFPNGRVQLGPPGEGVTVVATSNATNPIPLRRARPWRTVALAVAAVIFSAALAFAALRTRRPVEAATAPDTAASLVAKPAVAPEIALRIRTEPETTSFTIDSGPSRSTPYDSKAIRDDAPHKLRFSADGFDSDERTVSFGNDLTMNVVLHRPAPAPSTSSASEAPTTRVSPSTPVVRPRVPPPAPPSPQDPGQPRKPKHSIDEADPYGH